MDDIEDKDGRFDWAAPDEEVHAFVNEVERPVGTYLYGRRMYETMVFWESPPDLGELARAIRLLLFAASGFQICSPISTDSPTS